MAPVRYFRALAIRRAPRIAIVKSDPDWICITRLIYHHCGITVGHIVGAWDPCIIW